MTMAEQVDQLERERMVAIERERISRDAAFLHSAARPMCEDVAGYPCLPLSLYHCNLLRMMGSPFMPPFETPGPAELAAFLWVVSPQFDPNNEKARLDFFWRCREFIKPAKKWPLRFAEMVTGGTPVLRSKAMRYLQWRWEQKANAALQRFTEIVTRAQEYMTEARQDMQPANPAAPGEAEYYSDFAYIAATLMRNYSGMEYEKIQFIPLKVIYQLLKEIREHDAAQIGKPAMLWNGSDEFIDRQLAILNRN